MLLWLAQYLQDYIGPMRVFNFITVRAVFATITAITGHVRLSRQRETAQVNAIAAA